MRIYKGLLTWFPGKIKTKGIGHTTKMFVQYFCLSYRSLFFLQDWWRGEGLRLVTDRLDSKNYYATNPSFDK